MSAERLARLLMSQSPYVVLANGGRFGVLLRRDGNWVYFTAHEMTTDGKRSCPYSSGNWVSY
jgi:hypothetical protein